MSQQGSNGDIRSCHAASAEEILRRLDVDPQRGLAPEEVNARRARFGENRLAGDVGVNPLVLLVRQFTDVLIGVLLAATIVVGLIVIGILINITVYLREDMIHVKPVITTALKAVARKFIIFDIKKTSHEYI